MYASPFKRFIGFIIDSLLLSLLSTVVLFVFNLVAPKNPAAAIAAGTILKFTVFLLYMVYPQSCTRQATVGQQIMGLKVTDLNGERISFWRAFCRTSLMWVSALPAGLGFLMCFLTKKKQCLHDIMTYCLIVPQNARPEPNASPVPPISYITGLLARLPVWLMVLSVLYVAFLLKDVKTSDTPAQQAQKIQSSFQKTDKMLTSYVIQAEVHRIQDFQFLIKMAASSQQRYKLRHGHYAAQWKDLDVSISPFFEGAYLCTTGKPGPQSVLGKWNGCSGEKGFLVTFFPKYANFWAQPQNSPFRYSLQYNMEEDEYTCYVGLNDKEHPQKQAELQICRQVADETRYYKTRQEELQSAQNIKKLLKKVAQSQARHKARTGVYATKWTQLDIAPTDATDSSFYCLNGPQEGEQSSTGNFSACGGKATYLLSLVAGGANAVPQNTNWFYALSLYDDRSQYQCIASDSQEQELCQAVANEIKPVNNK